MLRGILFFILLSASICVGIILERDPGYILIALNHTTVEMTLWVGVFAILLIFFLLYIIGHLALSLYRSPKRIQQWRHRRQIARARRNTRKGLIEFSEGYWQDAKKHLLKALPYSDTPLINYLIAARAAQETGDYVRRDHYLREAQQSMPETKIAVELTQAQLQLANKQWEQALATLRHLQDVAPKHPYVLKLLARLYEAVKDWPQLITLLPELRKNHAISDEAYERLLIQSYLQQFRHLIEHRSFDEGKDFIQHLPKSLRSNPFFVSETAHFYQKHNQSDIAASYLKKSLSKHFNEALLQQYCDLKAKEAHLDFVESLLKKYPHSASLLLGCGKICLQLDLWGKAKKYLQQSIDLSPCREAYWHLANLCESLNQEEEALLLLKKGYALHK